MNVTLQLWLFPEKFFDFSKKISVPGRNFSWNPSPKSIQSTKKSGHPESNQGPSDGCALYSQMLYQLSYSRNYQPSGLYCIEYFLAKRLRRRRLVGAAVQTNIRTRANWRRNAEFVRTGTPKKSTVPYATNTKMRHSTGSQYVRG